MSAKPGSPVLRARIASALDDHKASVSATSIANLLGVSPSTITRDRRDLSDWPGVQLLELAAHAPAVRDAVILYLMGEDGPQGSVVAACRHALQAVQSQAEAIAVLTSAVADGRVNRTEAREALSALEKIQAAQRPLLADLHMIIEGAA